MKLIRSILVSCLLVSVSPNTASACNGVLVGGTNANGSRSCITKFDKSDGTYSVDLSMDTIEILVDGMISEGFREDDFVLVNLNRMADRIKESRKEGLVSLKYASKADLCEFTVPGGRVSRILPENLCKGIKANIHWRVSTLTDKIRSAAVGNPSAKVAAFRMAFLRSNDLSGLDLQFVFDAVVVAASGNTLISSDEQDVLNSHSFGRTLEGVGTKLAWGDWGEAKEIEGVDMLAYSGDFLLQGMEVDGISPVWVDMEKLAKSYTVENEINTWNTYHAAFVAGVLPEGFRGKALSSLSPISDIYAIKGDPSKLEKFVSLDQMVGMLEGLRKAGLSIDEMDQFISGEREQQERILEALFAE